MAALAALILVFAAIYYIPWLKKVISEFMYQYPHIQKLPGPKRLPFIGCIGDLAGDTTVPIKFWMAEAEKARAKGEGIFTITVLGRSITFPVNGEMLRYICESPDEILKGKDYDFLKGWIGDGILTLIGQPWRDRRKSYTPLFHFSMLEGYLETFNKHARILCEVLQLEAGKKVDMCERVKRLALDTITDAAMDINFDTQRDPTHPYLHAVHDFTHMQQRYINEPQMWVKWIWATLYHRRYKHSLDILNDFSDKIMNDRLKKVQCGEVDLNAKKRPLIDHFFGLNQRGEWTLDDVHFELNGVIFGGHDTTSATLTWIFWALGTQPEFQQQCFEEIHDIFGDSDRDCTHEDMKAMEFTERFIKETMRIFPPIPAVERELQNDFQMGDYFLPKGSEIFMAPHVVHRNPAVYPDPWKFDPDRWLPDNIAKRNPYDFIPFSAGNRNCLGQKFALHEIKTVLAWTLRKFSFSTDKKMLDQGFAIEVICKPTLPVDLLVTPRN